MRENLSNLPIIVDAESIDIEMIVERVADMNHTNNYIKMDTINAVQSTPISNLILAGELNNVRSKKLKRKKTKESETVHSSSATNDKLKQPSNFRTTNPLSTFKIPKIKRTEAVSEIVQVPFRPSNDPVPFGSIKLSEIDDFPIPENILNTEDILKDAIKNGSLEEEIGTLKKEEKTYFDLLSTCIYLEEHAELSKLGDISLNAIHLYSIPEEKNVYELDITVYIEQTIII